MSFDRRRAGQNSDAECPSQVSRVGPAQPRLGRMSASPPRATKHSHRSETPLCANRDRTQRSKFKSLFDHPVGARKYRVVNRDAKGFCRPVADWVPCSRSLPVKSLWSQNALEAQRVRPGFPMVFFKMTFASSSPTCPATQSGLFGAFIPFMGFASSAVCFNATKPFCQGLVGGAAGWPLAARAQQAQMPVVGVLHLGSAGARVQHVAAFRAGLKEAGYFEGQNVMIEYRWAEDQHDRLPELLAPIIRESRRLAM
jgi:hypothetical protein